MPTPPSFLQNLRPCDETSIGPEILLIEPNPDLLASRETLFRCSGYKVTSLANYRDVFRLHQTQRFALAVLSDSLGKEPLQAVARCVRRQWPSTRILIHGTVQSELEDHLYDEAIDPRFQPQKLLDTLVWLLKDPWNQRPGAFGLKTENPMSLGFADIDSPSYQIVPAESDPTKMAHRDQVKKMSLRDIPANAHGLQQRA